MLGGFDGLSLWVTAAGSKCWLFRYYWAGRQVCMSFGMYPAVSLKEALTRHDLLAILSTIEQRKAFTMAENCRTWFNQLFRYVLLKVEGMELNPASDLDVVALPKGGRWCPPSLRR
ncbi:DUF4102 domain-containing protein [Pseudomonas hygromyciniae]|uniref:DUF4102 domain-containing protein n=1 Tax=Pseudomonas hygromyciniae TaxID=2812000 RepID=A0ABX7JV62_9PSED|nr:DUF4102 domain-containing protein [Pseudomonas hygromyciniae]QSB37626.1 DUF4102 domain-containing protein [Pseudomonas hygromyciniae]